MMKKRILGLVVILVILFTGRLYAIEGMWIPALLKSLNEDEMQEMGLEITAEDIYSINNSSLKDAIFLFGGGCTAELVSDKGLLLTNHHCGYRSIQSHSTVEHDYLTDGFWAQSFEEELPNPGLTVTRLKRMEEVTGQVLDGVKDNMTESERDQVISKNIEALVNETEKNSEYNASVKPFYHGNQYYMLITQTFKDVRLVGAPPSNIGKFGGDTDNWMWPRHTGDFSVFRIYTDKNNEIAEYTDDNVPFEPDYHLPISLDGVQKGDFTFLMGYPYSTDEYLPSHAIEMITEEINPIRINLRGERLDIMDKYMKKSDKIRIQYSAKYAGVANGWKKWQGENRGIDRLNAIEVKREQEDMFADWMKKTEERQDKYGGLLEAFEKNYQQLTPTMKSFYYFVEAGLGIEIIRFARNFRELVEMSKKDEPDEAKIQAELEGLKNAVEGHFKNYNQQIDREVFAHMMELYLENIPEDRYPQVLKDLKDKYKENTVDYAERVFKKSFLASKEETLDFLNNYKARKYKKIQKDEAAQLAMGFYKHYMNNIMPRRNRINNDLDSLQSLYMKGLMEMQPYKRFYPNANQTLRVHYGKVKGYNPRDAVYYKPYTTLKGVMQKEDRAVYDYVVEDKLKQLYNNENYGRYAADDGEMHVCFIATNHTTGGNSGSGVFNAKGELVGLNFDRNWEGTMSDLMYDPDMCRNITLDIRYCLFIMDKFSGARHLVDEMTIAE
ncbi:MAG: S46 family peptidase [Bacteroidales bacterium]|nr:S46 family peptidase [Bacteroidales bacterium]